MTTHSSGTLQAATDAVVDRLDAGAGAGTIVFKSAAAAEVATCTFSATAFGSAAASGIATANAITGDSSATGGTVDNYTAQDSDTNEVFSGDCGGIGSGADFEFTSTTIPAGQPVDVSTLTYRAIPA